MALAAFLFATPALAQDNFRLVQTLPGRSTTGLVQATDGNFYGTTDDDGDFGVGTIFRLTLAGDLTVLHSFSGGADGGYPTTLIQARDGAMYGGTQNGGNTQHGTFFKITLDGTFTTIHDLTGPDGDWPMSPLVEASDGQLYGTTSSGGDANFGTIVRLTTDGDYSVLYSFPGGSGSEFPLGIIEGSDGNFYGTTAGSASIFGAGVEGTAFRMTPDGRVSILHYFDSDLFGFAVSPLAQGLDGNFYGIANNAVFRLSPDGTYAIVHSFSQSEGSAVGGNAVGLIQGSDGMLYGALAVGGSPSDSGNIFRMALDGTVAVLHVFTCSNVGKTPPSLPIHATDGNVYGVADGCTDPPWGSQSHAVVYRLDNPDPCDATLAVHYTPGTLNLGLTLRTPTPAFAGVWLFTADEQTKLWSSAVPVIDPAVSATAAIPLSNAGPLGVLSLLTDSSGHPACFDWRVVYTGP